MGDVIVGCGGRNFVTLYCSSCGHAHKVQITCEDRTCPDCRYISYKRLLNKYGSLLKGVSPNRLALITLTLKVNADSLSSKLDVIRKSWRKLIRRNAWKKYISGGLYVIESKKSQSGFWNVHIHCLVEVTYFRRNFTIFSKGREQVKCDILHPDGTSLTWQKLGDIWSKLTRGSYICDITPIQPYAGKDYYSGTMGALRYVMKYLKKSPVLNESERSEYNAVYRGVRIVHTFGSWYPKSKDYAFAEVSKGVDISDKFVLKCPECGEVNWVSEYDLKKELRRWRKECAKKT